MPIAQTNESPDGEKPSAEKDTWTAARGVLKDVFSELGGGENYLRSERTNFYAPGRELRG